MGWTLALAMLAAPLPALAQATPDYGADLERFDYPYPLNWFATQAQGDAVRMAYLDVAPTAKANGTTVVLFHGKNFCAATWGETIRDLAVRGYRVIAPDQIGFCKSSKPAGFQYSFHALAQLTAGLLDQAGVQRIALVGHSTGGVLATRFALLYPERVSQLVLVNPLGLNDTLAEGVPYTPLDALRAEETKTDRESIKRYQQRVYYHGTWRPAYDRWVDMLAGQYAGADGAKVREAQARLSDMIETQPIAAELPQVKPPVTLLIGQKDKTAFRANTAPEAVRDQVRTVPEAAETAVKALPRGRLVRLPTLGHSPMVEDPTAFHTALADALQR
ncbi:alpha/beta fold hydrolase [Sphingomonas sp. ac-8]|uniref:alpha/beta fold hydrolase n=1 Tax=Sphingomonas sp. ac-8 TaxID=3242977 RepID=UPI003A7FE307